MFQIKELEELNPSPVEEAELLKEREKLKNLSTLKETLQFLTSAMEEGEALFSQILSSFEKLSQFEERFKDNLSTLYSLYYELKEAYREVMQDAMHVDEAIDFIKKFGDKIEFKKVPTPSPFSFSILTEGSSDVVVVETRREFIKKFGQDKFEELMNNKIVDLEVEK